MITVTVIGGGFMGKNHARAVADHPLLALDSIVDVDADRASKIAETFDANTSLTDYEEALDRVDAAIIATPESAHAEQANAALDRGIHLLLEKPITESLKKARALADRSADADVVTGVSFVLRYDPGYAHAHQAVIDGDIGDLVAARVKRGITVEESRRIGTRGHPLYYMNVHDIDALLWCVDSPVEEVRAVERRAPGDVFSITTEDGYDRPDIRHWPVINKEMDGAVAKQIDRFVKSINGSHHMLASVRDGYRAQRIATIIEEAIDTGKMITPDEIG